MATQEVKPWNVLMFYVDEGQGYIEEFFVGKHEVTSDPNAITPTETPEMFTRCRVLLVYVQNGKLVVDDPFVSSFVDPIHYVKNLLTNRITGILVKEEYDYLGPFVEACQGIIIKNSGGILPS